MLKDEIEKDQLKNRQKITTHVNPDQPIKLKIKLRL